MEDTPMEQPPASILIIGSGLFGLSTAWELTKRPLFADTAITVVDHAGGQFPPSDSASVDTSRIVRADYADPDYTALATAAQAGWRREGTMSWVARGASSLDYVQKSWKNVVAYATSHGYSADKVRTLESKEALNEYLGTRGHVGDWGYVNTFSGWTDNGKSMRWLYERVKATQRVRFVDAKVKHLETEGDRVVGARLSDGAVLRASVVFVAAGAWSGELVDLRGRVEATGHTLAYIDITDEELAVLSKQPAVLHVSSGLFVLPPREKVLKVGHHGFGYYNPQAVTSALPLSPSAKREPIVVSRPVTRRDGCVSRLPRQADANVRRALKHLVPVEGLEDRPWRDTRLCWYSDTKDGDWLVDWHPGWKGLFLATGDSGHGFKFLPVLGEKVVDCLLGQGGQLGQKWRWREIEDDGEGREVDGKFNRLVTRDGSRGGGPATIWQDELARTGPTL
ncbi:FAD dependent oxidoreductase [Hirsutella rhossiliensis]